MPLFLNQTIPFSFHASQFPTRMFNLGGIAISDYLITNRARFRARGKCRNLTLKNAGRRRTKETVRRGVASRRSWVHSHTDSPRTQMTDVVIRFSQQQQQHLHPRRPSAIHSGIHTPTFATAVTSLGGADATAAAFEGRHHRRRSIALSRSFLRLNCANHPPPSPLQFTLHFGGSHEGC